MGVEGVAVGVGWFLMGVAATVFLVSAMKIGSDADLRARIGYLEYLLNEKARKYREAIGRENALTQQLYEATNGQARFYSPETDSIID